MSGPDDESPPGPPPANDAGGKVISLAGRRSRLATTPAPETRASAPPAPPEGEEKDTLLAQLDAWDLDAGIADLETRIGEGRDDLGPLRQSLRNWRAVRSHLHGDREAAAAAWAELIAEGFDEALASRASYAEKDGDFAAALADHDRAAQRAPRDGAVYYRRGLLHHLHLRDPERALADLARAAQLRPNDADPYLWMARIMSSQRNEEGAIRALGRAIKRVPWRADLFLERGRLWWQKGSHAEAIADFDKSIALDPTVSSAFQLRGLCHGRLGAPALAIADFSSAIALEPNEAAFSLSRGKAHLEMGAYEAAIADLSRVLELHEGENADAYYHRGAAHLALGDERNAARDYRVAFRYDSDLLEALEFRARVDRELGHTKELRAALDVLILTQSMESHRLLLERADLSADAGDLDGALADIGLALEDVPRWDAAFVQRARTLARFGRFGEAVEDMSRAVEASPHLASHHAQRAVYRAHAEGDTPGARADLQHAVEMAHYDPEVRSCRVTYFKLIGRLCEAMVDLDMLIMLDRHEAQHYVDRAVARLRTFEDEASVRAALFDLDCALILDEGHAEALAERERARAALGLAEGESS